MKYILILSVFVVSLFAQSNTEAIEALKNFKQDEILDSIRNSQGQATNKVVEQPTYVFPQQQLPADTTNQQTLAPNSEDSTMIRYGQFIFQKQMNTWSTNRQNFVGKTYPLKPSDKIVLSVWGGPEYEEIMLIDSKGMVQIDGVGKLSLNGLTLTQAEWKIRRSLKKKHIGLEHGTTQMSLRLQELSPIRVTIVGEVVQPGSVVLQGNSNILALMYQAKGITNIGSLRKIKLNRDNKAYTIDLYEHLIFGKRLKHDILRDGDIIYVPPASKIISVEGAIGRSYKYELIENERVLELIRIAGGLLPNFSGIYHTQRSSIQGKLELITQSMLSDSVANFELRHGDEINFSAYQGKVENFIEVEGLVNNPGKYQMGKGLTLKEAIAEAGGLQNEAFQPYIELTRQKNGITTHRNLIQIDSAFPLQNQDVIKVLDNQEINNEYEVIIDGEVKKPKKTQYAKSMTIATLLLQAKGYSNYADTTRIVIERLSRDDKLMESIVIELEKDSSVLTLLDVIQPNDRVIIPKDLSRYNHKVIKITGAVSQPRGYSLIKEKETIKEFFDRTNIINQYAYIKGARFFRKDSKGELQQVAISVDLAIKGDKKHNITLDAGDSIFIPKHSISVKVIGGVNSPGEVLYERGLDVYDYIARAGGLTNLADEDRIFVTYANGSKISLDYLRVNPDEGSTIFVGEFEELPESNWLAITQASLGIISGMLTIVLTLMVLNNGSN